VDVRAPGYGADGRECSTGAAGGPPRGARSLHPGAAWKRVTRAQTEPGEDEVAEIRVERRKRSPLPWILGLLLLAVIAFVAYRMFGAGRGPAGAAGSDGTVVVDTARP
jgi:hypothetical protein